MTKAMDQVMDAIDIETFLISKNEEEARRLAETLMAEMNLGHSDIVFLEHKGLGARVRLRHYVHRPGDHYRWLQPDSPEEGEK